MDEILLARVLEQKHVLYAEFTDDETIEDFTDEYMDDEMEYDTRKGRPVIV